MGRITMSVDFYTDPTTLLHGWGQSYFMQVYNNKTPQRLKFCLMANTLALPVDDSFKTFYVQKHRTEIIEVKVWPHIVACYRREIFKVTNILWKVDTNLHLQYIYATLFQTYVQLL